MFKYLYDSIAQKWYAKQGLVYIYSDPHFGDEDCFNIRKTAKKIPEGVHTVKELDEYQIKSINNTVHKNDTLVILGDIGNIEYLKKLNAGYKVLIMGNHDSGASNYKRIAKFEKVVVENYLNGKTPNELCIELSKEEQDQYYIDARKRAEQEYRNKEDFIQMGHIINHEFCAPFMSWTAYFDNKLFDEVYEGPLMINNKIILSHELVSVADGIVNGHGHTHTLSHVHHVGKTKYYNFCAESINYTPVRLDTFLQSIGFGKMPDIHRLTINTATDRAHKKHSKE